MDVKWVSKHIQVDSQDISSSEQLFCMANICVASLFLNFYTSQFWNFKSLFVTLLNKGKESVVLSEQRKLKMAFTKKIGEREERMRGTAATTMSALCLPS